MLACQDNSRTLTKIPKDFVSKEGEHQCGPVKITWRILLLLGKVTFQHFVQNKDIHKLYKLLLAYTYASNQKSVTFLIHNRCGIGVGRWATPYAYSYMIPTLYATNLDEK